MTCSGSWPFVAVICLVALATPLAAQQRDLLPTVPKATAFAPGRLKVQTQFGVTFLDRGDHQLKADLYLPEGDGPFPGILMVHGGAWVSGSSWNLIVHANYLASRGYVVMATNYRKAPANLWPAQLDDCKAAVRYLRGNATKLKVDPNRLGGWGYSAGGQLVTLLAVTDAKDGLEGQAAPAMGPSTRLQAVVAGGAPVDFLHVAPNSRVFSFFLGGSPREKPEAYRTASAATFASGDDPPILFFHGESDPLVPRAGVDRLIAKLKEHEVPAELFVIPQAEHLGAFLAPSAMTKSVEFFDRTLKAAKPGR